MGTAVAIRTRLQGGPRDGACVVLRGEPAEGDEILLWVPRAIGADEPERACWWARYRLADDGRWRFEP